MMSNVPSMTEENRLLTRQMEQLNIEFTDLFILHRWMVEDESVVLTSLYQKKLGQWQLRLLIQKTEAARLKRKRNMIQAAINRNEKPDIKAIDQQIRKELEEYYQRIAEESLALEAAKEVLTHLVSPEIVQKIKEVFRVLCKRLHPDLHPQQSESDKDLFVKVKSAYDLHRLEDLQNILLMLDDMDREQIMNIPVDDKKARIKDLTDKIALLQEKINTLNKQFPFNQKSLLKDEEQLKAKKQAIMEEIAQTENEIASYQEVINLICDE